MIGETAKSAVRGLDSIVYTDQEKAQKTQQAQELYSKMWLAAVPSALTRRIIASITVLVWALLIVFGVAIYKFDEEWAKFSFSVLKETVLQPHSIILGFYFLSQVVTRYNEK